MERTNPSLAEKLLFRHPVFYKIKCFVIETLIWKWILSGILRLDPRPIENAEAFFRDREILLAACGPGNVSTGPSVDSARGVTAVDISNEFARACHKNRPEWRICVADVLKLPFANRQFDVSVIYSSLHHIPAAADLVLAELARVTRSQVVFFEGVVREKGLLRLALLVWYRLVDGGVHYYTRAEMLSVAEKLDLEVERVTRHGPIGHMLLGVLKVPPQSATRPRG